MLISVEAQNASLGNDYGPNKGASAPTALQVALWDGDPRESGTAELPSTGGYARVTGIPNDGTTWPDAPTGGAITSAPIDFGTSTDEWPIDAKWWVIFDDADGTTAWDANPITGDGLSVSTAGTPVMVQVVPTYNLMESA